MPKEPRRRATFPASHRLKRQRLIRPLFDRGRDDVHAVRVGPVTVRYRIAAREEVGWETPVQIGFAVGRAIGSKPRRNRLKRVMREVYRAHRHALEDALDGRPGVLTLMVLYRGRPERAEATVRRTMPEALRRVAEALPHPPDLPPADGTAA